MSFSSGVKDELSRQIPAARHCRIAETAAILSLCGRIKISGQDFFSVEIHTENNVLKGPLHSLADAECNHNTASFPLFMQKGGPNAEKRRFSGVRRRQEWTIEINQEETWK